MAVQLVWLKRDLRALDHAALAAAAEAGPTVAVYVFEPSLWAQPELDPSHFVFLSECLAELRPALDRRGVPLLFRIGELPEAFERLHEALPFRAIHAHEETGLRVTWDRDRRVARWCRDRGISFREKPQFGVFRPHPVRDGWGARWEARMKAPLPRVPERFPPVTLPSTVPLGELPEPSELGLSPSEKREAQRGGETRAHRTLETFLAERAEGYERNLSSPARAWNGCSRLSPHLAFGTIALARVHRETVRRLERARARREPAWQTSLEAFRGRLRWHCHFMQKLEDEPELELRNAHRGYDGLRTEAQDDWTSSERARFAAWREGRTGFPMVDAAIRCLHRTGWINFRMRAMLASFACHHLWLHWRAPAVELARHFLDFEPGIHFSQFQMQAGTAGINTTRVYDVRLQARRHDAGGAFIRRFVPELASVPLEHLAEPHRMPAQVQRQAGCRIGRHYPPPIVDHDRAAAQARRALEGMKRRPELREEAGRVAARHGSRRSPRSARR